MIGPKLDVKCQMPDVDAVCSAGHFGIFSDKINFKGGELTCRKMKSKSESVPFALARNSAMAATRRRTSLLPLIASGTYPMAQQLRVKARSTREVGDLQQVCEVSYNA